MIIDVKASGAGRSESISETKSIINATARGVSASGKNASQKEEFSKKVQLIFNEIKSK